MALLLLLLLLFAVVVYFEYVDFVVFAAGAIHTLFVECVPTVVEIVVVVVDDDVVADDVVEIVDLRYFGHFFQLIKNQTLSIDFPYKRLDDFVLLG